MKLKKIWEKFGNFCVNETIAWYELETGETFKTKKERIKELEKRIKKLEEKFAKYEKD